MKSLIFCLICTVFFPISALAEKLPLEHFVTIPSITSPNVSPDGKHIAALIKNQNGSYDVAVTEFGSTEFSIVAKMENPTDRIGFIYWANNERLLISSSFQASYGDRNFYLPRLYAVNIDGSNFIQIHKQNMRSGHERGAYYRNESIIISTLENDKRHILLEFQDTYDEYPSVYKVDIYNNEFEKLFSNDYEISSWFANSEGEVLWGIQYYEDNDLKRTYWHRKDTNSEWKKLKTVFAEKGDTFYPVLMDEEDKFLYVLSNHKLGRTALWKYDIASGAFKELVYSVEGYDLGGVHLEDGKLLGVYWQEHFSKSHYFDKEYAALKRLVRKTFVGAKSYISSSDESNRKIVVSVVDDNVPRKYYLLDLEAGKASFWFSQYPYLEGKKLTDVRPFKYTARDGMELNGYFAMPSDPKIKNPPLIVLPHGGPWGRDSMYFDYLVQLFANRGYAVLQMNFRGSTGFGDKYEEAGYKQVGLKMQTDIVDAVQWAKENTSIDESRMCIVGWSYGGFAALTASYQTPELYDCHVSIAGSTDLIASALSGGWRWESENVNSIAWGNPSNPEEKERMYRLSPIHNVRKSEGPILLVHGESDGIVSATHSRDYYTRAKILGKDVEYVEVEHGIHGLSTDRERLTAFKAIDEFLKKNLQ